MRQLFFITALKRQTLDIITFAFNQRIGENGIIEDENVVEFNYSNIVNENFSELAIINDIVHLRKEHKKLLKHPLLEAMIMMKWRKFQWLWLLMLVLQFIFTMLIFRIGTLHIKFEPNKCQENQTEAERTVFELEFQDKERVHLIPFCYLMDLSI